MTGGVNRYCLKANVSRSRKAASDLAMIHLPSAPLQDCSVVSVVQAVLVAACNEVGTEQKGRECIKCSHGSKTRGRKKLCVNYLFVTVDKSIFKES